MSVIDPPSSDPAAVRAYRGSIVNAHLRGMADSFRRGHSDRMGDNQSATSTRRPNGLNKRKLTPKRAFVALAILLSLIVSPSVIGERRVPGRQAFVPPTLTARERVPHPCVFASLHGSALFTSLGECSSPSDRSNANDFAFSISDPNTAAVDHFEADLRHGTFVTRQIDLVPDRGGAVPLTRSYISQAAAAENAAAGFGPNMETSLNLTPKASKRPRRNTGINLAHLQSPRGGWVHLAYDSQFRISEARSQVSAVRYIYNQEGMLSYAFNSSGIVRHYLYDHSLMIAIEDENRATLVHNRYRDGILCAQQFANGDEYSYKYKYAPGQQQPDSVTVTLPDQTERVISFATSNSSRF